MIQNETPKVKFSFCQVLPCQLSREISHFTKFIDALDSCSSELFKKETDPGKAPCSPVLYHSGEIKYLSIYTNVCSTRTLYRVLTVRLDL